MNRILFEGVLGVAQVAARATLFRFGGPEASGEAA